MITGDYGKVETTMYYDVGAFGISFGVTNGVVSFIVNGNVTTGAIDVNPIVDGTTYVGTITAVVSGILTITSIGTLVGTSVTGMITGDVGICVTTIYYDVGAFVGILPGVTIGVVNLMVYGVTGKV